MKNAINKVDDINTKNSTSTIKAHRFVVPLLTGGLFVGFFALAFFKFYYVADLFTEALIAKQVEELKQIIERIDSTAKILSFEHDINYIDFLNVKSFVGSEVGPLNLAYPDKWEGPYLRDNPTIQEKYYQIAHIKDTYYIVPGNGVKIADNKIIGQDIIFNDNTHIEELVESGILSYNGKLLIAKLNLSFEHNSNPFDTIMTDDRLPGSYSLGTSY